MKEPIDETIHICSIRPADVYKKYIIPV